MLSYLVTSRARRALVRQLWSESQSGSVSALAKRCDLSFSTAQRELVAMERAGLAVSTASGNRVEYRANPMFPQAELLKQLLVADQAKAEAKTDAQPEADDKVRSWLKEHGAPLSVPDVSEPAPDVNEVVVEALELAHRDATVARALPVLLWRHRDHLDWDRLRREARVRREDQTLGFFVELAGKLGHKRTLEKRAQQWRDKRRTKPHSFFDEPKGRHARALEKQNTPPLARRWCFTMNMPLDSFSSLFEKFAT